MILVTWAGSVEAAPSKKDRVKKHKNRAFELFNQGDFATGIAEMEKAYGLIPHPGFLLNIAVAYDRWPGHCAESLDTLERFFIECDGCRLMKKAKAKKAEIEETCRVPIRVTSTPAGASVAIDGTVRGKTPWTTELLPGTYAILLDLGGHERATRSITVERASPVEVDLPLVPRAAPPPPPPPPAVVMERPSTGPHPATWVAFGIGAAGVITGVAFTVLTYDKLDREEAARTTPLPKAEIEALQDDAQQNAIIAHVGYGIGAAGIAAGLVLFFLTKKQAPVSVAVSPDSVGVWGRF